MIVKYVGPSLPTPFRSNEFDEGRYQGHLAAMNGPEVAALVETVRIALEAFRLTREYVGEELLPAIPGWSWYDATVALKEALSGSWEVTDG